MQLAYAVAHPLPFSIIMILIVFKLKCKINSNRRSTRLTLEPLFFYSETVWLNARHRKGYPRNLRIIFIDFVGLLHSAGI